MSTLCLPSQKTFSKSQIISASCNDLGRNYKTNKCIQRTVQINNISFRLQLRLNNTKYIQYHLIVNQLPANTAHIVAFCRLHCNFLTLMGEPVLHKQTKLFQKQNDYISWPVHQLKLSTCKKYKTKTTEKIQFQCDIQLLQIKEKQYISRFVPVSTSAQISFEWNITENFIHSFKKSRYGKAFYSRDISNIWCLSCYPTGTDSNSSGSLLLSLQLLRLPIQVSSFQITFLLQCEEKIWIQKKCLFGYDSLSQIWPCDLFKTEWLQKLRSMILKVSINIDRVSGIDGKEIYKPMWNKNKIQLKSTEFALDMEIDINSMTQLSDKQLEEITVVDDEQKGEEKHSFMSMVERRFVEWLCDELELDKYLAVFQRYDQASMYKVRFLTDITLQEMGINDEYDQQKILNAVDEFRFAHNTFERILYNNIILKDYTQQLQMNGIFTLNDIAREIRCKEDIERLFNLDEEEKINEIWDAVSPSSEKDIQANICMFEQECKQTISKMGEIHQQAAKMQNNIFSHGLFSHVINEFMSNLKGLQLSIGWLQRSQIDSRRTSGSGVDTLGIRGMQKSTSVITETNANVSSNNHSSQCSSSSISSIAEQFNFSHKDYSQDALGLGNMSRDD